MRTAESVAPSCLSAAGLTLFFSFGVSRLSGSRNTALGAICPERREGLRVGIQEKRGAGSCLYPIFIPRSFPESLWVCGSAEFPTLQGQSARWAAQREKLLFLHARLAVNSPGIMTFSQMSRWGMRGA